MKNSFQPEPLTRSRSDCIDLSLPDRRLDQLLSDLPDYSLRCAIRDWRHRVRLKMFGERDGISTAITPWGVWQPIKDGLYQLHYTLDNLFLDTELAAAFLPKPVFKAVYPRMEHSSGITLVESAPARKTVRELGRAHLMAVLNRNLTPKRRYSDEMMRVRLVAPQDIDKLAESIDRVDRELAFAINESFLDSNKLLKWAKMKADEHRRKTPESVLRGETVFVTFSVEEIISELLTDYGEVEQWFFINTKTLAFLSGNVTLVNSVYEEAWLNWSILASLAGLPAAVLSPHGGMDSNRPLSPSNSRFDPIFSILQGMWALGSCDEYDIWLSTKNPTRAERGVYMRFRLGGKGWENLRKAVNSGDQSLQLAHPVYYGYGYGTTTGNTSQPEWQQMLNAGIEEGRKKK